MEGWGWCGERSSVGRPRLQANNCSRQIPGPTLHWQSLQIRHSPAMTATRSQNKSLVCLRSNQAGGRGAKCCTARSCAQAADRPTSNRSVETRRNNANNGRGEACYYLRAGTVGQEKREVSSHARQERFGSSNTPRRRMQTTVVLYQGYNDTFSSEMMRNKRRI